MTGQGSSPSRRGQSLSSAEIERFYPAAAPLIARGELSYAEKGRMLDEANRIDEDRRGDSFNGIEYFRFRFPEQGAAMSDFLLRHRLHRLVPNSTTAATPEEVAAEWQRMASEREVILAWARSTRMLIEIVQTYRFERRRGAYSYAAHRAAAELVRTTHPGIVDAVNYAGVCIEWAEREHRDWFWRCCRDHHLL